MLQLTSDDWYGFDLHRFSLAIAGTYRHYFSQAAHGYVARFLGDETASRLGRVSLNPIRHIDAFGTIIFTGTLARGSVALFVWIRQTSAG